MHQEEDRQSYLPLVTFGVIEYDVQRSFIASNIYKN